MMWLDAIESLPSTIRSVTVNPLHLRTKARTLDFLDVFHMRLRRRAPDVRMNLDREFLKGCGAGAADFETLLKDGDR